MDQGDERLNKRAKTVMETFRAKPMASIPIACNGLHTLPLSSSVSRFTRLLNSGGRARSRQDCVSAPPWHCVSPTSTLEPVEDRHNCGGQ